MSHNKPPSETSRPRQRRGRIDVETTVPVKMPQDVPGFQSRRPPPEPEALDISILYEDESLMALDKAPGMVVHPTYRNWSGTLLNGVLWHLRGRAFRPGSGQAGATPHIITRLDK